MQGSCPAGGHPETSPSPHVASLLRHASPRSGRGSAHHSDPVRPSRPQRDHPLPPSFTTSSPRDGESSGLTEAERPADTGGIDEPAAPGGGRSHPQRRSCLPRTKSPVAQLEACQSAAGHCAVSYRCTRRSSRSVHPLRASRHHLLQLLPKSALPEVSDRCSGTLDRSTSKRTSPDALRPCGLHTSSAARGAGFAEQESHLRSAVPHQCGNTSRSRSRSETPRRGNRLLHRAAYLESEARAPSPCPLRHSRRWPVIRSHPLGKITRSVLSSHPRAPSCFPRQVCCCSPAGLSRRPTQLPWKPDLSRPAQDLRRLATAAVQKGLGGVLETTLRWPGVRAPVFGSLHPSCGHLQSSLGLVYGGEGHLPLAGLRS